MSSFLRKSSAAWGEGARTTIVAVDTVDNYCIRNGIKKIDVLNIDTQGYDLEVLIGASTMLNERVDIIITELNFVHLYEGAATFDQIYKFLADRNFLLVGFYNTRRVGKRLGWTDGLFIGSWESTPRRSI